MEGTLAPWPPDNSDRFPLIGRLPAYVFTEINEEKARRVEAGHDVIDLGMGNPDLGTPSHVVEELISASRDGRLHRYSTSRGIPDLRHALAEHYASRFGVTLDAEREVVVTIGAQEGISHLMLAILDRGEAVIVPSPTYPIHHYSVVFAGGEVRAIPLHATASGRVDADALLAAVEDAVNSKEPRPKALFLSFPHNPTCYVADRPFWERVVALCRRERLLLIHDFAYADFGFDQAPTSVLSIPGASEFAVEFFSMSKSYSMGGWRVGFCVGNEPMVQALTRIKSYLDYGIFEPIQIAAAAALRGPQEGIAESREVYRRRRDSLVRSLLHHGWPVPEPPAGMFVWAPIPARFTQLGSVAFARVLLAEAGVVVAPGIGFGAEGDGHVRFALIEGEERLRVAAERIGRAIV